MQRAASNFTLIAKAGGSDEHSENTCAAIEVALAVELPDWARLAIEVDVRTTAEEKFVVIHDASLDRTTTGRGLVRRHTLEQLRALSAGPGGERIPVLEEVLELVADRELVLEVHDSGMAVARALVQALKRTRAGVRERIIVASEASALIHAVRALDPQLRTAATAREAWRKLLLTRMRLDRWAARGHPWLVPEVHRGLRVVTRRFAESAARAGDDVWVFVVNQAADVARLRRMGVGGCFTTCPASLARALRQLPS